MSEDEGVHVHWRRNGDQIKYRGTYYDADIEFDWEPDEETVLKYIRRKIHDFDGFEYSYKPFIEEFEKSRYRSNSWHVVIFDPYSG